MRRTKDEIERIAERRIRDVEFPVRGLKSFRRHLWLTQAGMAARIGVSFSTYEKVERGKKRVTPKFLRKFKTAFPNVDVKKIFPELEERS